MVTENGHYIASSDDALLRRVAGGDQRAFAQLYDRFSDRLFIYCCRLVGDRDVGKDALQDALIKIYQNAAQYQPGTNATAWVFRLTRNVCIDMLRSRREFDDIEDLPLSEEERTPDVLLQDALTEEIEKLPAIYREAVVLRDVQGHSYEEIASIVDVPLSTVKFRIFKARETLRRRLVHYLND